MPIELIAFLAACLAALALFVAMRYTEVDSALWLMAWPVLLAQASLIVVKDGILALALLEQGVGPWVAALQCMGAWRYTGRRLPGWLIPATVAVGLARAVLLAADASLARHAVAFVFDLVAYGLAVWALARDTRGGPRRRQVLLALGLVAMAILNAGMTLADMRPNGPGAAFWPLWTAVAIPNFSMQLAAILAHARERARRTLRSARRDVTTLVVGSVAHDFNNLLTAIEGFTQLADADLAAGEYASARESMRLVHDAVDRASTITRRMLEHIEAVPRTTQRIALEPLVADVVRRHRTRNGPDPAIECQLTPTQHAVRGDPRLIETAIELVLQNAGEHGRGAPIELRVDVEHAAVAITGDAETAITPGDYLAITVRDRGPGVRDDVRAHLFEPFITTHEFGRGLGLAAVAGIARLHGGLVRLQSSPAGTSISLWFPTAVEPTATRATA